MTTQSGLEGLSIADVSRALSVPAPTLRAWERRYGIAEADRSPGGHRRYTTEQVDAMRLMRDEIARGRRAASAARAVRELLGMTGPSAALVEKFLAASADTDVATMRDVLERARAQLGVDATVDSVLVPSMRRIGLWWSSGRCDTAQEALATEVCRGWLNRTLARSSRTPDPGRPPVLLASAPADDHTIGIEALELCLRLRGVGTRSLGPRVSVETLRSAVLAVDPPAVVVACQLPSGRRRAVEVLSALSAMGGPHLFYAGSAFASERSRRGVPGCYLGGTFAEAAGTVAAGAGFATSDAEATAV